MKFTVNDKTYFVKWEYPDTQLDNYPVTTVCKIYDTSTSYNLPLVEGVATLSVGDRFCKNIGRKISLNRALNKLFPNLPETFNGVPRERLNKQYIKHQNKELHREAKAIAWTEYFKESPKRLK